MAIQLTSPKQLTTPVVATKPNQALAAIDVYKTQVKGVVNSIQDKLAEYGLTKSTILQGFEAPSA